VIHEESARSQVARLDATEDYRLKTAVAVDDLVEVVRILCDDDAEAEHLISFWLNTQRLCPTVVDLRDSLKEIREGKPEPKRSEPTVCSLCHGRGHYWVFQICTPTESAVLTRDLPNGASAQEIRDQWRAEREAWLSANPEGYYQPPNRQYLTTAGRKCACR
jgi:hypothetical protein